MLRQKKIFSYFHGNLLIAMLAKDQAVLQQPKCHSAKRICLPYTYVSNQKKENTTCLGVVERSFFPQLFAT